MRLRFLLAGAAAALACSKPAPAPAPAPAPTQPAAQAPNAGRGVPPTFRADARRTAGTRRRYHGRPGRSHAAEPGGAASVQSRRSRPRRRRGSGCSRCTASATGCYFEIPAKELDKDQLVVGRLARAPAGNQTPGPGTPGFGEYAGDRVRRRARCGGSAIGNRVDPALAVVRDHGRHAARPCIRSVQNSNYASDHRRRSTSTRTDRTAPPVIDVTRLFTTNVPEFAAIRGCARSDAFVHRA